MSSDFAKRAAKALEKAFVPPGMIAVVFSCRKCGLTDEVVTVEGRRSDEDILAWMNKVRRAVYIQHTMRKMGCDNDKVDLVIPVPNENEWIGQPKLDNQA